MQERLYTLGDLVQDLHGHSLDQWFREVGRGATWRATSEKKLDRVNLTMQYTLAGSAWVYVTVVGKRSAWTRDYAYKAWPKPGDLFKLDARSTD